MENQELTIKLTVPQWNVVMQALGEIPLKNGIEVFNAIRSQADAQLSAPANEAQPS